MKDTSKVTEKKKGFWAALKVSMTKTGGCCGSGGNCCAPAQAEAKKEQRQQ